MVVCLFCKANVAKKNWNMILYQLVKLCKNIILIPVYTARIYKLKYMPIHIFFLGLLVGSVKG